MSFSHGYLTMGVDFFPCHGCDATICDAESYWHCRVCNNSLCEACEKEMEVEESGCPFCEKRIVSDTVLLTFALEQLNMSRGSLVNLWRQS